MKNKDIIPKTRIFGNIESDLWKIVKINNWDFSKLLAFGVKMRMAEEDMGDFPPCKLLEKIGKLNQLLESKSQLLEEYQKNFGKEFEKIKKEEIEGEFKNVIPQ